MKINFVRFKLKNNLEKQANAKSIIFSFDAFNSIRVMILSSSSLISVLRFKACGVLFNLVVFVSAEHLPRSNSVLLMKHLAVWDAIAAAVIGINRMTLEHWGVFLERNVRILIMQRN